MSIQQGNSVEKLVSFNPLTGSMAIKINFTYGQSIFDNNSYKHDRVLWILHKYWKIQLKCIMKDQTWTKHRRDITLVASSVASRW